MDLQDYIESGIIEDYCLGTLSEEASVELLDMADRHPEIKHQIDEYRECLETYSLENMRTPSPGLKKLVFELLDNLVKEEERKIESPPLLNKYSDYRNWLEIARSVLPPSLQKNMFIRDIRDDDSVSQTVIWTRVDYPDEVHENEQESFIILEGKCRCHIAGKIVELGPGEYLEIPLFAHHNVEIIGTQPVLAIVQRVKVA